jgi:exosortase C (VPDSG-CTERM-specific)
MNRHIHSKRFEEGAADLQAPRSRLCARISLLAIVLLALTLFYADTLYAIFKYAAADALHSQALLVPPVFSFLVWKKRHDLARETSPDFPSATLFFALALVLVAWPFSSSEPLVLFRFSLSYIFFVVSGCAFFLGRDALRSLSFPLGFLLFIVPPPPAFIRATEALLQHGSAWVALAGFTLADTPVLYQNLIFQLPGIQIGVAPECSGLNSTLALFLSSLLAGHLLLRSTVGRVVLTAAVLPLGLLRNGLRIFIIGELCVQRGPDFLDSYLHRNGGPLFFLASLLPLGALFYALYRRESRSLQRLPTALACTL